MANAQQWSKAFHDHTGIQADGILYPARHNHNRRAIAIFERAPEIREIETLRWHDGGRLRPLLAEIHIYYGFDLIETKTTPPRKGRPRKPSVDSSISRIRRAEGAE